MYDVKDRWDCLSPEIVQNVGHEVWENEHATTI